MPKQLNHRLTAKYQRGVGLIEALIALLILALGLLGLAGMQMRSMAEARGSTQRTSAVRLVDDLNERMQINVAGVKAGLYHLDWGVLPAAQNCSATACTVAQQAAYDLSQWKANVKAQLQNGDAKVFISPTNPSLIGVMIAWSANEGVANKGVVGAVSATYLAPFNVNVPGASCPSGDICHVVYLQPCGQV